MKMATLFKYIFFLVLVILCQGKHLDYTDLSAPIDKARRSPVPLEYQEDCDGEVIICDLREDYCDRVDSICKSCDEHCSLSYLEGLSDSEYHSREVELCQQRCKIFYEFTRNNSEADSNTSGLRIGITNDYLSYLPHTTEKSTQNDSTDYKSNTSDATTEALPKASYDSNQNVILLVALGVAGGILIIIIIIVVAFLIRRRRRSQRRSVERDPEDGASQQNGSGHQRATSDGIPMMTMTSIDDGSTEPFMNGVE